IAQRPDEARQSLSHRLIVVDDRNDRFPGQFWSLIRSINTAPHGLLLLDWRRFWPLKGKIGQRNGLSRLYLSIARLDVRKLSRAAPATAAMIPGSPRSSHRSAA